MMRLGRTVCPHHPGQRIQVRHTQGRVTQRRRPLDQFLERVEGQVELDHRLVAVGCSGTDCQVPVVAVDG